MPFAVKNKQLIEAHAKTARTPRFSTEVPVFLPSNLTHIRSDVKSRVGCPSRKKTPDLSELSTTQAAQTPRLAGTSEAPPLPRWRLIFAGRKRVVAAVWDRRRPVARWPLAADLSGPAATAKPKC